MCGFGFRIQHLSFWGDVRVLVCKTVCNYQFQEARVRWKREEIKIFRDCSIVVERWSFKV